MRYPLSTRTEFQLAKWCAGNNGGCYVVVDYFRTMAAAKREASRLDPAITSWCKIADAVFSNGDYGTFRIVVI